MALGTCTRRARQGLIIRTSLLFCISFENRGLAGSTCIYSRINLKARQLSVCQKYPNIVACKMQNHWYRGLLFAHYDTSSWREWWCNQPLFVLFVSSQMRRVLLCRPLPSYNADYHRRQHHVNLLNSTTTKRREVASTRTRLIWQWWTQ